MENNFQGVIFSNKHTDINHIDMRGGTGFSKKHWRPLSVFVFYLTSRSEQGPGSVFHPFFGVTKVFVFNQF